MGVAQELNIGTVAKKPFSGTNPVMTMPSADKLHRYILKAREEHAKLNPDQFIDWDEAKKRIQRQTRPTKLSP